MSEKNNLAGVAKDRLDKVLERISQLQIRFPNAEIKRRTGFNEGNISNILKGKIPMSDKFFASFMEKFPVPGQRHEDEGGGSNTLREPDSTYNNESPSLKALIYNNRLLAEAHLELSASNRTLADTNAQLTQMLHGKPTASAPGETPSAGQTKLRQLLLELASIGVAQGKWSNEMAGLMELGKLFFEGSEDGTTGHTEPQAGKQDKATS